MTDERAEVLEQMAMYCSDKFFDKFCQQTLFADPTRFLYGDSYEEAIDEWIDLFLSINI